MASSQASPRADQDPICPACSEPIQSKVDAVAEHGELFHPVCRSRLTRLQAFELVDRAQQAVARAEDRTAGLVARHPTRWLVIVARDFGHTAPDLAHRYEGRAQVLVDRRDQPSETKPLAWSGPERRRPLTEPEAAM
jgi:hypothetical protein